MNKQRKVLITTTYNEMGVIVDTKAEEVAQPDLQPTCNQLATDTISRQAAIDTICAVNDAYKSNPHIDAIIDALEDLPSVQPEPTYEQVLDYCKKRCLCIVTADVFQSTHLTHKVSFGDKDHVWIDGKQYISLPRFQEAVKEAEPKKGYWKKDETDDCPPIFQQFRICSECGAIETAETKFCPSCGARMGEKRNV